MHCVRTDSAERLWIPITICFVFTFVVSRLPFSSSELFNSIVMILGQLFKLDVSVPSFSNETWTGAVGKLGCFALDNVLSW